MVRDIVRHAMRAWSRSDKAPGYYYRAVENLGASLGNRQPILTTLPNGCTVLCDLRDHVQRHQWFFGAYEPVEAFLFARLLRPGQTVIDAGANVGQYTLLAATGVGPGGGVHSFEPVPANFATLQAAVDRNGLTNVRANRAALWNEESTLKLALPSEKDAGTNAGAFSVGAGSDGGLYEIEAPAMTLDAYAEQEKLTRIDLIKMDIEGSEPKALAGAKTALARFRPMILMEINREALEGGGTSAGELWSELKSLGYRAWGIGHSAAMSRAIPDIGELVRQNVLFHVDDLPRDVVEGWDLRSAHRWARSRW